MEREFFSAHEIISKTHHDTVRLRSRPRCRSQARSLLPEDTAVYRLQHYCPFRADSSGEPRCLVRVSLKVERDFFPRMILFLNLIITQWSLRLDLTGRFFVSQAVHKMFTFSAAHFTALIR